MKILKDRLIGVSATLFVGVVALSYPEIFKSKYNSEITARVPIESQMNLIVSGQALGRNEIQTGKIGSVSYLSNSAEEIVPLIENPAESVVGFVDEITNTIKSAINVAIDGWNALQLEIPEINLGLIKFGGFTLGLPPIEPLTKNGVVLPTASGALNSNFYF